ncbi:MAG: Peptidase M16 inactive domain protein [bacterium ADurb.Bin363]|nr:MAG: Peptidase M16 inactive domain protein [bacterium ADurb.Bin363]
MKKRNQTCIAIGYPTVPASHKDYPVFEVMRGLTTGDGGRFWNEIRGKRGLAYVIHTYHLPLGKGGSFLSFTGTSPDTASLTEELLLKEFRKLYEESPGKEELTYGKNYIIGNHLFAERTTAARTLALAGAEATEMDKTYVLNYTEEIQKVTTEQIREAGERYFLPGQHYKAQIQGKI